MDEPVGGACGLYVKLVTFKKMPKVSNGETASNSQSNVL